MRAVRTTLRAAIFVLIFVCPAPGHQWEAIHREMHEALATLSKEYFESGQPELTSLVSYGAPASEYRMPWLIVVGFTGGVEGRDSAASGIVAMKNGLQGHVAGRSEVLAATYNNFHWRRAASDVTRASRTATTGPDYFPATRQPLIAVYGHSWGAGSIAKFARELEKHGLEISLAIYIDAFTLRNPRVPANVRYAVNFFQRSGVLSGLPLRGKSKLIPQDPEKTQILGNYRIDPQAGRWGWSWNALQPLFYRQHHLIAHDVRLKNYIVEIVNLKLDLLKRVQASVSEESARGLFDRVVILGASVSAGEKAPSPGLLLARHMATSEDRIFTFAEGGAASVRHLGFLDNIARLQPTLIVALDLFYHDFQASLFLSNSRKRYLHDYLTALVGTGAVVVLGNIPNLVLLRHEHVNRYLEQVAAEFPNLVLMDVDRQIESLEEGLVVRMGGEEIVVRHQDVFADRVHPNLFGSTLIANFILERLQARFPDRSRRGETDAADAPGFLPLPARKSALHVQ